MKINIATIFDKNYMIRMLAFYDSLVKFDFDKGYKFWLLCLDDEAKKVMSELRLPNVILMTIDELCDKELLATKQNRSKLEYIFTSKSAWIHYILNKIDNGDALLYNDCDLFYFSSPDELLSRMGEKGLSIGIVPHRFPKNKAYMNEKVGKFNAGLLYLIADKNSRLCISEWRRQCIEWCYLKYEKGRFGDQLYINRWPEKYQGVYEIKNKGVNLGSWSIYDFNIIKNNGVFYIDGERLICYHFHRTKFYLDRGKIKPLPIYVYHRELYGIYTQDLEKSWDKLLNIDQNWIYGFVKKPSILRIIKQGIERSVRNLLKI